MKTCYELPQIYKEKIVEKWSKKPSKIGYIILEEIEMANNWSGLLQ